VSLQGDTAELSATQALTGRSQSGPVTPAKPVTRDRLPFQKDPVLTPPRSDVEMTGPTSMPTAPHVAGRLAVSLATVAWCKNAKPRIPGLGTAQFAAAHSHTQQAPPRC
jgi:hypothetical protein